MTLNWVFTLRENEAPLTFSLLLQPLVFVVLIMCVAVVVYSIKNRNGQNPREIFQNLAQRAWSWRLEQGGKKNAGEESCKFSREARICLRCFHVSAVGGFPCQGTLLEISKKN